MSYYSELVLSLLPTGYWRFNEAAGAMVDSAPTPHNGTVGGGVTQAVPGLLIADTDAAAAFDGSSGRVIMATTPNLQGDSAFSAGAWINMAGFPNAFHTIIGILASGDLGWWLQVSNSGQIYFWASRDGTTQQPAVATAGTIKAGQRYLVGCTYDGQYMRIFRNGVAIGSVYDWGSVAALHTVAAATSFAVGRSGSFNSDYLSGVIDEPMMLKGVVLSQAQWGQLYQAGEGQIFGGRLYVQLYDADGAVLGPGPIFEIADAEIVDRLDRIGEFYFTMPHADERAALVATAYEARLFREGEGELMRGIVEVKAHEVAD